MNLQNSGKILRDQTFRYCRVLLYCYSSITLLLNIPVCSIVYTQELILQKSRLCSYFDSFQKRFLTFFMILETTFGKEWHLFLANLLNLWQKWGQNKADVHFFPWFFSEKFRGKFPGFHTKMGIQNARQWNAQ